MLTDKRPNIQKISAHSNSFYILYPTAAINPCQAYPEIHINEQKFKIK